MEKQFKGWTNKSILMPRPELDGFPRKVDYKKLCAELKKKELDKWILNAHIAKK